MLTEIHENDIQKIYECIAQAVSDDKYEAAAHLGLRTHISNPFLTWDLIYRNLMNTFDDCNICSNIKYSATQRGMWTVLLLFDENSKLLISFMRESRFDSIRSQKAEARPQYIQALLTLNEGLESSTKQISMFPQESKHTQTELENTLSELCANFNGEIITQNSNHVLVVFSDQNGSLTSMKAYILDRDLDIVDERDCLDVTKPIISVTPETVSSASTVLSIPLKSKALDRIKEKGLVAIKEKEEQGQA